MPDKPAPSLPPPPPGAGGSGQYIGIAVVLLACMGGLLCWKFKGGSEGSSPTEPTASAPSAKPPVVARPTLTDAPPPPPPDDDKPPEDAGPPKTAKTTTGSGGGGCAGVCSGSGVGTKGDIAGRAGAARGCYERALRQNSNIQGKINLSVRVDPSGNVCSASITSDSVGSPEVSNCVLGMFRGQHLSPPTGGCADFAIPLNFQPKNK